MNSLKGYQNIENDFEAAVIGHYRIFANNQSIEYLGGQDSKTLIPNNFAYTFDSHQNESQNLSADSIIIKYWTDSLKVTDYLFLAGDGLTCPNYTSFQSGNYYLLEMRAPLDMFQERISIIRSITTDVRGYISIGYVFRPSQFNKQQLSAHDVSFYLTAYKVFEASLTQDRFSYSQYQSDLAQSLFSYSFLSLNRYSHILKQSHRTETSGGILADKVSSRLLLPSTTPASQSQADISVHDNQFDDISHHQDASIESPWYSIVYSRTYQVDYQFLAMPDWLNEHQVNCLRSHILPTFRKGKKLRDKKRWSIFSCEGTLVFGVTCLSSAISEHNNQDISGRAIPIFFGYATQGRPSSFPNLNSEEYINLYETVDEYWDTRVQISPKSKKYYLHDTCVPKKSTSLISYLLGRNRDVYEINQMRNTVRVWEDLDTTRKCLWNKAIAYLADNKPVSLCLGMPTYGDISPIGTTQASFPFLNVTLDEGAPKHEYKDFRSI